jgi:hypothetical protein
VTYSLVNAPALAYDLVRLPHGLQAGQVVRTALACGPDELSALAARHPGPHRAHRWGEVMVAGSREPLRRTVHLADEAVGSALAGDTATSTALVRRLERAALGDVAALDRMLRHDVLDWTWLACGDIAVQDPEASAACDVLADAAASAYCSEVLDDATRRSMAAPYLATRPSPPRLTGHEVVDAALSHLAGTDEEGRRRWRRAVDQQRPGTATWAPAMHEATWALSLAGRLRLAADAQLAAAEAFSAAGFTPRDAAYGVWNAVSGSVQALVAADLLPGPDADLLLACWRRVHRAGPAAL